jgi:hypothetical protein
MSAAITSPVAEPGSHEPTVHEWLSGVRSDFTEQSHVDDRNFPSHISLVATTCSAAINPLEIAASLEASGVSRTVVTDVYGQADVFALAEELWFKVPFRPVDVPQNPMWRVGSPQDLGRGALYAAPALMLLAFTRSLGVQFAWWSLPLAITWGWALGQVSAHLGYSMRGRQNLVGERLASGWLMMATIVTTTGFALLATVLDGGTLTTVVGTTCVTVYMVSSAIMLLNEQERLAATLLVPGGVVTIAILVLGVDIMPPVAVAITIGGSATATLFAAARHMRLLPLRALSFTRAELRSCVQHLVHGLLCGLALTLVAILGGHIYQGSGSTALFALPLLLTLGVMEWQLRTFRAGVEKLAGTLVSLDDFAPRSWALFRRAFVRYLGWTALASVVVGVIVEVHHATPPYMLLTGQIVLGATYYVDLTLLSLSRLAIVTRCWLNGLGAGVLWFAVGYPLATSVSGYTVVWSAAIVATTVTLASMLIVSPGVVSASMSH